MKQQKKENINNKINDLFDNSDTCSDLDLELDNLEIDDSTINLENNLITSKNTNLNNKIFDELDSDNESLDLDITTINDKLKNKVFFLKMKNFPVNYCFLEKMEDTLDDLLDEYYDMSTEEWFSILFQISFGLAITNKYFKFVHNDLHSSNIMFQSTPQKYLYFYVHNRYYKIPTFGKITKIIDFARGTFKFKNEWIFSDVFGPDGEAEGQYTYPDDFKNIKNCTNKPNPSFDLVRFATTILERLDEQPEVLSLITKWCISDDGSNMLDKDDDFELYIDIAHNCHNAVPIDVLDDKVFKIFTVKKEKIPNDAFVYKY